MAATRLRTFNDEWGQLAMAKPITTIEKNVQTEEQLKEQKLDHLKSLLAQNEEAVQQLLAILGDLNDIGALDAATNLLAAKEETAHIVLGQLTRKPVTNLISHAMGVAGALTEIEPATTAKLLSAMQQGLDAGEAALAADEKISMLKLAKMMNDPDVNRALKFGVHFLKGFGQSLK